MPDPSPQKPIGTPFIELQSIGSTNNYALEQAHAGLAQHGTIFFAHEQLAGKGQRGKTWLAERTSSLLMSVVINPSSIGLAAQFRLSACVAVAAYEFFQRYAGEGVCIKWPNDLYWHDRKAGGILIENVVSSGQSAVGNAQPTAGDWKWAVIGIGININQASFPPDLKNPVSLRQITGKESDPVALAKELGRDIDKNLRLLSDEGFEGIYGIYQDHLYKKNQAARLKKGNRVFQAIIRSVTPTGNLTVQHAIEEEFTFGEVEWLIPGNTP